MTAATTQEIHHHSPAEVRLMAKELADEFQRVFSRWGDGGRAFGLFPVIGREEDSLDDDYRLAEPGDSISDYHIPINARQGKYGPHYVHVRQNRYERRGVLIPDISGKEQPGSKPAIYEQENLIATTVALLLQTVPQLGHKSGLILPEDNNQIRVIQPEAHEGFQLEALQQANQRVSQNNLKACLQGMKKLGGNTEFSIIVSDFLKEGWEEELLSIGQRIELAVFQIIDPRDVRMPNLGQRRISQGGKIVVINTGLQSARDNYAEETSQQQAHIAAVLKEARAHHFKLTTTELLKSQMLKISRSKQMTRHAA